MNDPMEEIQAKIFGNIREIYNDTVADHAIRPRRVGSLLDPDGFASVHSDCGESMEIWLKVKDNHIDEILFWTDGCAATIACGSMAAELSAGKNIADVLKMDFMQVVDGLDGLPEGNFHCAELAAKAVKTAALDYLNMQRDPWKKAYRKK
ncbi:MAG: iron-sulfur cluster assembly scaffold protein [Dehalococcoidales bacterium]|nr:iron-sulfur cluster assembly scaffold protein [Dehalococcoidales bacterium]